MKKYHGLFLSSAIAVAFIPLVWLIQNKVGRQYSAVWLNIHLASLVILILFSIGGMLMLRGKTRSKEETYLFGYFIILLIYTPFMLLAYSARSHLPQAGAVNTLSVLFPILLVGLAYYWQHTKDKKILLIAYACLIPQIMLIGPHYYRYYVKLRYNSFERVVNHRLDWTASIDDNLNLDVTIDTDLPDGTVFSLTVDRPCKIKRTGKTGSTASSKIGNTGFYISPENFARIMKKELTINSGHGELSGELDDTNWLSGNFPYDSFEKDSEGKYWLVEKKLDRSYIEIKTASRYVRVMLNYSPFREGQVDPYRGKDPSGWGLRLISNEKELYLRSDRAADYVDGRAAANLTFELSDDLTLLASRQHGEQYPALEALFSEPHPDSIKYSILGKKEGRSRDEMRYYISVTGLMESNMTERTLLYLADKVVGVSARQAFSKCSVYMHDKKMIADGTVTSLDSTNVVAIVAHEKPEGWKVYRFKKEPSYRYPRRKIPKL